MAPASPRFQLGQSWASPDRFLMVGLSEEWRCSIQAVHAVNRQMDVGVYAGRQMSNGKKSDFLGAGVSVHF